MKTEVRAGAGFSFYELMIVIAVIGILVLLYVLPEVNQARHRSVKAKRVHCTSNLKNTGVAFRLVQGDITPGGGVYLVNVATTNGGAPNVTEIQMTKDNGPSPFTYQVFGIMSNELNTPKLMICPADERDAHSNFVMGTGNSSDASMLLNQHLSYFVGRDVQMDRPQMFISGDRNLGTGEKGPNSDYGYSPEPEINTGFAKELGLTNTTVQWTAKMHKKQGNVLFVDGHVASLTSEGFRETLKVTGDTNATATKGNLILFP